MNLKDIRGALSINVVVVAAIAMIVLVILSFLVFDAGDTIISSTSCEGLDNNQCFDGYQNCNAVSQANSGEWTSSNAECSEPAEICCTQVGEVDDGTF